MLWALNCVGLIDVLGENGTQQWQMALKDVHISVYWVSRTTSSITTKKNSESNEYHEMITKSASTHRMMKENTVYTFNTSISLHEKLERSKRLSGLLSTV